MWEDFELFILPLGVGNTSMDFFHCGGEIAYFQKEDPCAGDFSTGGEIDYFRENLCGVRIKSQNPTRFPQLSNFYVKN